MSTGRALRPNSSRTVQGKRGSKRSARRAALFRSSQQNLRIIELIDENGVHSQHSLPGRMNITSHQAVLAALEARANRSSGRNKLSTLDEKLLSSALDETGTVDIVCEDIDVNDSEVQQQIKNIREISITDERLKIHGRLPPKKGDGTIRLIYENANGINNRLSNNDKVEKAKEIHDDLEVDVVAYNEHRLNMKHKSNVNGFNQLFRGGESSIQSVVAHNVHENISKVQEGGTCLMMFGPLTSSLDHSAEKKDPSGLGRWSVMTVQGEGFKTRIVCGYNP